MPKRDLHLKPFDESTREKLGLYRKYLREWLPVFVNNQYIDSIQVFDFFAGPGKDVVGTSGSPLITCEEIRQAQNLNGKQYPKIRMYFNEYDATKFKNLSLCINEQKSSLPDVSFTTTQNDFHSAFGQWKPLMTGNVANLLFLDQNGVNQITKVIFQTIVQLPKTDLLFFISSAMVNRFRSVSEIRDYVPVTDEDFSRMDGTNVHRIVADAYRRWIPSGSEYYLGSFSIRKGPNVYGLVFGSGHPLGIDKFLKVAWERGGDANFDIDRDGIDRKQLPLPGYDKPAKIRIFEKELKFAVLEHHLTTNKDVYIFALQNGMKAVHARDALKILVEEKMLPKQTFHVSYDAWKKPNAEIIRHVN